jgi:hypothetical protein
MHLPCLWLHRLFTRPRRYSAHDAAMVRLRAKGRP